MSYFLIKIFLAFTFTSIAALGSSPLPFIDTLSLNPRSPVYSPLRSSPILRQNGNEVFSPLFGLSEAEFFSLSKSNPDIFLTKNYLQENYLHIVCDVNLAEIAILNGADINARSIKGKTPLDKLLSTITCSHLNFSGRMSPPQITRIVLLDLFVFHDAKVILTIFDNVDGHHVMRDIELNVIEACIFYHSWKSQSFDYFPTIEKVLLKFPSLYVPSVEEFTTKMSEMMPQFCLEKIQSLISKINE